MSYQLFKAWETFTTYTTNLQIYTHKKKRKRKKIPLLLQLKVSAHYWLHLHLKLVKIFLGQFDLLFPRLLNGLLLTT